MGQDALIGGLHGQDTKQAVLSKVDEIPLDDTVTFVDERTCKFCGKKGYGRNTNEDLRKADCSAFRRKYNKCWFKGHHLISVKRRKIRGMMRPRMIQKRLQQEQIPSFFIG